MSDSASEHSSFEGDSEVGGSFSETEDRRSLSISFERPCQKGRPSRQRTLPAKFRDMQGGGDSFEELQMDLSSECQVVDLQVLVELMGV